jgi:hypothetical protein
MEGLDTFTETDKITKMIEEAEKVRERILRAQLALVNSRQLIEGRLDSLIKQH